MQDGSFHGRIAGFRGEAGIEFANEAEALALEGVGFARLDICEGRLAIHLDDAGLVLRGQEAIAEETQSAVRHARGAALEHDKAGEVFVLRAEAVVDPGAGARVAHESESLACRKK